jgi:uncharacterized protein YjbI with pentapeptide repeats
VDRTELSSLIHRRGYIVLKMAEGRDIPIVAQQKQPGKRPPWWKRLWGWTEFGKKSGWEYLELLSALAIPVVIAVAGFWFTAQQDQRQQDIEDQRAKREQKIENQRAQAERELEEQRAQDESLQAYLDQMNTLLLDQNLRDPEKGSEARTLARARTLTVLGRLDPSRKTQAMRFLGEANLVQRVDERGPLISLEDADLEGADLSFADLRGAKLSHADLSDADLNFADLSGADLSLADLTNATLREADLPNASLGGANLSNVYLYGAYLKGASMSSVDLRGADLYGANLSGVDLSGANLTQAEGITKEELETEASFLGGAIMPDGSTYPYPPYPDPRTGEEDSPSPVCTAAFCPTTEVERDPS